MSRTGWKKLQRCCSFMFYAFSPRHIKMVLIDIATTYETPKIVTIPSYPIALTCRMIQLLICAYAFGYILWYKRGYQDHDPSVISSVILKVRGIGTSSVSPKMTMDSADFVVPPQENNAIFIMTNYIRTDQHRTRCAEGIDVKDAVCQNNSQCMIKRKYSDKSNGRWTGNCRVSENRCEMEGWCPVENDLTHPRPVYDALNYTLIVRNFIEFTRFNISRKNLLNDTPYYDQCIYHPVTDPLCPAFRVGDLLDLVEDDVEERQKMLIFGAVVRIKIDWICNLDLGDDECKPEYSFGRLDSRSRDEKFSFGFNFRYASHWKMTNLSHRMLTKAFGLRFIVTVNGDAGRFDLFVLTLNVGSMIGILGLATVICDLIVLHFGRKSHFYRQQKFQSVDFEQPMNILSLTARENQMNRRFSHIQALAESLL